MNLFSYFAIPNVKSAFDGSENISYLSPKIWNIVPLGLKEVTSVVAFKKGMKEWKPKNCPCRLCKSGLKGVLHGTICMIRFA